MTSNLSGQVVSRRLFLAQLAALGGLGLDVRRLTAAAIYSSTIPNDPIYMGLERFIRPGSDEFPEEAEAMRIRSALQSAVLSGELPTADRNILDAWQSWRSSLGTIRRAQFSPLSGGIVRYEVATERTGKLFYRVGLWRQKWVDGKLTELALVEEDTAAADQPWFTDITAACFAQTPSFHDQLARGIPYWRSHLDPATGIDIYGSNGIAVGDIDNDGEDEIYVCQPGGLPNRLFKFASDGSLLDITDQWQAGILDNTASALFLDLRNIGRQDLVVLRDGGPILLLNTGDHFAIRTDAFQYATTPAGGFTGMAAADYDRDGKLDLYLCCYIYFQSEAQYTYPSPYHDAQNGPPNFLFHNDLNAEGGGVFRDVTAETGISHNNNRFSFAPAWCDYNDDGWPDLYVANDFGRKNLYRNQGGKFRDVAKETGVEDLGPGMSASWFDYDNDGRPDLYVANMWSESGQRLLHDPHFLPAQGPSQQEAYRRHTKGNSLFWNRGDGSFEETTLAEHCEFGRWAWSSGGHDFDNDGRAELFITCGMLTNRLPDDLMSFFWRQVVAKSPVDAHPSAAYEHGWNVLNQFIREDYSWNGNEPNVFHVYRNGRFHDYSGVSGLDFAEDGRAFAVVDIDHDGRPDIVLKNRLGPQIRILRNNCCETRQSVTFLLKGTKSNRDAIGAKIQVDGQTKWLEAGSGYLSQHSKRVIFGLGSQTIARHTTVTWPSGLVQHFSNLSAGQVYVLTEGSSETPNTAYRSHNSLPSMDVKGDNTMSLADTWFVEPIPLPEWFTGPALLVLTSGVEAPSFSDVPVHSIDLAKASTDQRRHYEIFRRYLFDWRTSLDTPLSLLLDKNGNAVKIYGNIPDTRTYRIDLAAIPRAPSEKCVPFPGIYIHEPRREYYRLGAAFLWEGYPEQALPYLEMELRRTPDNSRILLLVGQIHLRAERIPEADAALHRCLQLNDRYAEAWSELGGVSEARNNFREALDRYNRALELKPDLIVTLLNAGRVADHLNDLARAQGYFQRAVELDPQSPAAANGLGLALAKQDQFEQAKKYFEQAIRSKRDFSEAINNLGVLYLQQGNANDAIAAFQYGIKVAPDEDILYLNLGRTYIRTGQNQKAREIMQGLLDRKPNSEVARHALQELDRH